MLLYTMNQPFDTASVVVTEEVLDSRRRAVTKPHTKNDNKTGATRV